MGQGGEVAWLDRRRRDAVLGLAFVVLTSILGSVGAPVASASPPPLAADPVAGTSTEYPLASGDQAGGITVGPDGALWFTKRGAHAIGRVTTDGAMSSFTGAGLDHPESIVAGPDSALWFTDSGTRAIGRITTTGVITTYTDPGMTSPQGIAAGPDGALWFTDPGADRIGRITTDGSLSFFADANIRSPLGITTGSDGALWFTNHEHIGSLGRIGTDGTTQSFAPSTAMNNPTGITLGPDGAIWFLVSAACICDGLSGQVFRFADGSFERASSAVAFPSAIAFGADGAAYFPNQLGIGVGRLSMTGELSTLPFVSSTSGSIQSVASGPDGRLWYTSDRSIVAANVLGVPTPPLVVVAHPARSSALVEWYASRIPGSTDLEYVVTASPGGSTCRTAQTSCSVTGLDPGSGYTFSVVAVNGYGTSTAAESPPVKTGLPPFVATPSGSANVTTARSPDGRVELFARDAAGGLIHRWQVSPSGPWSDWQWMGVFVSGTPAVAPSADGRLELWATDGAGGLIHSWQLAPNGVWSAWQWTGVFTQGSPTAAAAPDGRLEIFALDPAGGLIHAWQLTPNGVWSGWWWTGAFAQAAPGLQAHDGRLEMFAVDPNGGLIHSWQLTANGPWSEWHWMGFFVTDTPTVTIDDVGRLRVYSVGTDGRLLALAQFEPDGTFALVPLPPALAGLQLGTSPAAMPGPDGRENLFALDAPGLIVHAWVDRDAVWRSEVLTGAEGTGPVAAFAEADGRLSVLATDLADGLITNTQTDPASPDFGPWWWTGVFVT